MWVMQLMTGGLLGVAGIEDIRTRRLGVFWLVPGIALLAGSFGLMTELTLWERILGAGLGAIMMIISWASRQAIGLADSSVLMILGISFGASFCMMLTLLAFGMAALLGIGLLIFRQAGRKTRLPFLPFLFGAFVLTCRFYS